MRFDDEDEYGKVGVKLPTVILIASMSIFAILAIVLVSNNAGKKNNKAPEIPEVTVESNTVEETESAAASDTDSFTADDLDFWDMYKDSTYSADGNTSDSGDRKGELEKKEAELNNPGSDADDDDAKKTTDEDDPSKGGKYTKVTHMNGKEEWIAVNSSFKSNNFDDMSFESQNGIIGYYMNGRKTTKTGVDISQYSSSIDWNKLAYEVDYVMIRVGARGYDSGRIISDTAFIDNVTGAVKAGIPFGIYFSSQAATETEAKEEAEYVITQLAVAKAAVESLSNNTQTNAGSDTANNSNTNQNNIANVNSQQNNTSNNTNQGTTVATTVSCYAITVGGIVYYSGEPSVTSTVAYVAEDNDGNVTTLYSDGTAVTKYADGTKVTAYSNSTAITNYTNGTTKHTDAQGNTVSIEASGNVIVADPQGNTTATGTATLTSRTIYTTTNNNPNGTTQGNTLNNPNLNGNVNNNNNSTTTNQNGSQQVTNAQQPVYYRFNVDYPIALEMHLVANDTSRIEKLSNVDRTAVVKTFCDTIKTNGYTPMINTNKEMILTKLNLSVLGNYDFWLENEGELPDYPYQMSMWRYDLNGDLISSVSGDYGVSTCFIDYYTR